MDKYESPTIEQVGGGKSTPNLFAALVAFVYLATVAIDVAAVLQAAVIAEAVETSVLYHSSVTTNRTVTK